MFLKNTTEKRKIEFHCTTMFWTFFFIKTALIEVSFSRWPKKKVLVESSADATNVDSELKAILQKGFIYSFDRTPLLIISLDGFRNSYLQFNMTPHIQKIFDCGTQAKFMMPVFPSKTFPNHYSIATGLYPVSHGIVDNGFVDPAIPDVGDNF